MTIDWDAYRAAYPTMSYAEVAAFHRIVWAEFPDQHHFWDAKLEEFFSGIDARAVVELGGWTGQAAAAILARTPSIERWDNFEICEPAVLAPATADPRYHPFFPVGWPWESQPAPYDTAVLAHVIEHMAVGQLRAAVAWLDVAGVRDIYVEAPLGDKPRNWCHSTTAHLLSVGWPGVLAVFEAHGFRPRAHFAARPERDVFFMRRAA